MAWPLVKERDSHMYIHTMCHVVSLVMLHILHLPDFQLVVLSVLCFSSHIPSVCATMLDTWLPFTATGITNEVWVFQMANSDSPVAVGLRCTSFSGQTKLYCHI